MTIGEAKKVLKDLNLNLEYNEENTENEEERIITEQVPVSGVEVLEESSIINLSKHKQKNLIFRIQKQKLVI